MDLIQSTNSRANADQIGLALKLLGVKRVEVTGSLVVVTHKGQTVNIRLCRENIPFVWWVDSTGTQHLGSSFDCAKTALGLNGFVRSGTILTRAMKHIGLSNSRKTVVSQDFHVHGEYNSARERVRTVLDFRSFEAAGKAMAAWDELRPALDLTGYAFRLKAMGGHTCYIHN